MRDTPLRRQFTKEFKTKVAMDMIAKEKSIREITREYDISPGNAYRWLGEYSEDINKNCVSVDTSAGSFVLDFPVSQSDQLLTELCSYFEKTGFSVHYERVSGLEDWWKMRSELKERGLLQELKEKFDSHEIDAIKRAISKGKL